MPAYVRRAVLSSSTTTDVTVPSLGSVKAAILFMSQANTTSNPANNAVTSIGFWDGSSMRGVQHSSADARATSVCNRAQNTSWALAAYQAGVLSCEYAVSAITDGIRFSLVTDNTSLDRYVTCILFYGDDVQAKTGTTAAFGPVNNTQTISVGFEPSLVFVSGIASTGAVSASALPSLGVALNDDSLTQRTAMGGDLSEEPITNTRQRLSTIACWGYVLNSLPRRYVECTGFTSSGFKLTGRISGTMDYCYYLALKLPDDSLMYLDTIDTATTTGLYNQVVGFQSNLVMIAASGCLSVNNTEVGHSLSFGAASYGSQSAIGIRSKDNADTSDADSRSLANIIDLREHTDGSDLVVAKLYRFTNDGFTLNYTSADVSARKGWVLAINAGRPPLPTADVRFITT